jgi:hypothetical protein
MNLLLISIFLFPISQWRIHLIKAYLSIFRSSISFFRFWPLIIFENLSWLNHILRIARADVLLIRIALNRCCRWLRFWHKRLNISIHRSDFLLFLIFIHLWSWLIRCLRLDWIIFYLLLHTVSPIKLVFVIKF